MENCAHAKMTQEARIQAAENMTFLNTNENVNIPNEEPQKSMPGSFILLTVRIILANSSKPENRC